MLGAQEKRACIAAGPFGMADSGGFEPPTARFVAEYSIQLSYECAGWCSLARFTNWRSTFGLGLRYR